MKKFEAGKKYQEWNIYGNFYETECVKVTEKTATFRTVYGDKRMTINRTLQKDRETVSTPYKTTIEAR